MLAALRRASSAVLLVAATYAAGVILGAVAAHAGVGIALRLRDRTVAGAQTSPILAADRAGYRTRAALLDFTANVGLGAVPSTLVGALFSPGLFPLAAYRGWIGGIVSIDRRHVSRLATLQSGAYYLIVVGLQLIPYSLAGATGLVLARARRGIQARGLAGWASIPSTTWVDVARIYLLAAVLFLVASLFEFLSPWR